MLSSCSSSNLLCRSASIRSSRRIVSDPRLRQLFGRYATYCGSSPFAAPATLMLVAHAERSGVWLVEGGMRALAAMLAGLCEQHGVAFHFNEPVTQILASPAGRAVAGVVTGQDRMVPARRIIHNGDEAALAALLDHRRRGEARPFAKRSLSALVACTVAERGSPVSRESSPQLLPAERVRTCFVPEASVRVTSAVPSLIT